MLYRTGIGLDVHARSIAATAFIPETGEMVRKAFPHGAGRVAEWARGMPQPAGCACGSGPAGSGLKRKPGKAGVPCVAGAVSKMLGPSGDRARTDRRDAAFLARMLAVGSIVEVAMPAEAMEAARGLARAREDCRHGPMRARHLLSKFLLRKGIVYPGKAAWTKARREWLGRPGFADPCGRPAFGECLESVRSPGLRRARPDRAMEERAAGEDMAPAVSALRRVRGIPAVTAFSIAAEIGDFSRFPDARSFMSFVGLVPSESSSGESVSRGRITRTSNIHVRTLLVEAAWQHARPLRPTSAAAMGDAAGVRADVAEAAARANRRLHSRAAHLRGRGKPASVVNAAIARELAGFVRALARMAG